MYFDISLLFSSLRGRQLLSCLALRPQTGPNALPLTNQKPNDKGEGLAYILLKKGKRKKQKALSFLHKGIINTNSFTLELVTN